MPELAPIVPHPRTLRKAREQIKLMVIDGVSLRRIKNYLRRWAQWWMNTSSNWTFDEVIIWFLRVCWDTKVAAIAVSLVSPSVNADSNHYLDNDLKEILSKIV